MLEFFGVASLVVAVAILIAKIRGAANTTEAIVNAGAPAPFTAPESSPEPTQAEIEFLGERSADYSTVASGQDMSTVFASVDSAVVPLNPLDELFKKYGAKYNIEPRLLRAIAVVESSLRVDAIRNNPPHDVSVGLMQILCIPDAKGFCTNKFNVDGWKNIKFNDLLNPDLNVSIGTQILAWNIKTYGYARGIAVYNNWSARNSPVNGPFPNQSYVNKVFKYL